MKGDEKVRRMAIQSEAILQLRDQNENNIYTFKKNWARQDNFAPTRVNMIGKIKQQEEQEKQANLKIKLKSEAKPPKILELVTIAIFANQCRKGHVFKDGAGQKTCPEFDRFIADCNRKNKTMA